MTSINFSAGKAARLACSLVLLALAYESLVGALAELRSPIGPQGWPGLSITFAVALAGTAAVLMWTAVGSKRIGQTVLAGFGVSWLAGVFLTFVVVLARRTPLSGDAWTHVIDVVGWLVVLAIVSLPGLGSLLLARRA